MESKVISKLKLSKMSIKKCAQALKKDGHNVSHLNLRISTRNLFANLNILDIWIDTPDYMQQNNFESQTIHTAQQVF